MGEFEARSRKHSDGRLTIELVGELDMAGAPVVLECLRDAASEPGGAVLFDLSRLAFLDSVGISSLIEASKEVRAHESTFSVRGAQGAVRRVLELTGLIEYLEVEDA